MMMAALDDELAGEERAELEAHLGLCTDCAREWRTLAAIEMLFRQTPLLMPAVDFAERTLARLPNRQARRVALGVVYGFLLLSGIAPLLIGLFLAARYAPILSQPELLDGIWASLTGVGRAVATIIEALFTSAGRFVIEQPALIGWFIILAGLVCLWGGVFQRLLMQPAETASRN
jgi:anti-sigma factor RsiW